ncbi:MAG: hypothetical protein M3R14_05605 [Acidobacteriota bacterium]|nr:hypothetical protein [Acidobacteriota bacterium]
MKNILLLGLILFFLPSCLSQVKSVNKNSVTENNLIVQNSSIANEPVETKLKENDKQSYSSQINSEIRKIDFRNFSYPDEVIVKNGKLDLSEKSPLKTPSRLGYTVEDIRYAHFTNDAKVDALIDLTVIAGGGSTIYKHSFHLYTLRKRKALLIWRVTTGSEADCGLKEIWIENAKLILEVFGKCHIEEDSMQSEDYDTDVNTKNYTNFTFGWNGQKFVQEKLAVLPFTENNIHDYKRKMSGKID